MSIAVNNYYKECEQSAKHFASFKGGNGSARRFTKKLTAFVIKATMIATMLVVGASGQAGLSIEAEAAPTQSGDVYIIETPDDLVEFAALAVDSKKAKLANDIVFPDEYTQPINLLNNAEIDGCGYSIKNPNYFYNEKRVNTVFSEIHDSTVKNLTIELTQDVLWKTQTYYGVLATRAENTTFEACIVKGKDIILGCSLDCFGALTGEAKNCTFKNCTNSVSMIEPYEIDSDNNYTTNVSVVHVGGVCGTATKCSFDGCENSGTLFANMMIGGICGVSRKSDFSNCYNSGLIGVCKSQAGGICGLVDSGNCVKCENAGVIKSLAMYKDINEIGGIFGVWFCDSSETNEMSYCKNTGDISCRGAGDVGGMVGCVDAQLNIRISNCINEGSILAFSDKDTGGKNAGGIVGDIYQREGTGMYISQCTNTGDVTARDFAGGIIGYFEDSSSIREIDSCYNTGDINVINANSNNAGGIIGDTAISLDEIITNCEEKHEHTYKLANEIPATHDKEGEKKYSCICGITKIEVIPRKEAGKTDDSKKDDIKKDDIKKDDSNKNDTITEEPKTEETTTEAPKKDTVVKDAKTGAKVKITDSNEKEVSYEEFTKKTTSVVIPDTVAINGVKYKVTSIKANAFKNNKKLKKVTIGKNIKKIGKNAFYGCKNLKSIKVKTTKLTKKSVGKNAFAKINKKAVVKVPSKKLKLYKKVLKARGI